MTIFGWKIVAIIFLSRENDGTGIKTEEEDKTVAIVKIPETGCVRTTEFKGWVFSRQFSGSGPLDRQITEALSAALAAVEEAGADRDNIVKCDVVLRSADAEDAVLNAYRAIVSPALPAFKFQPIAELPEGFEIGIELTALRADAGLQVERFAPDRRGVPASVRAGEYIYTSMLLPDEKGDFAFEAQQAVAKAVRAVEAAGGRAEQIVKNFALIDAVEKFGPFNAVYAQVFRMDNDPPARSLIGVDRIGGGYQAAMESIAYLGGRRQGISIGALAGKMPFCSAMRGGDFLFVSGQIGVLNVDGTYNVEPEPQTEHLYRVIHAVTAAGGRSSRDYLKCNGFYLEADYLPLMERYLAAELNGNRCAEAIFPVTFLADPAILVEMDLVTVFEE